MDGSGVRVSRMLRKSSEDEGNGPGLNDRHYALYIWRIFRGIAWPFGLIEIELAAPGAAATAVNCVCRASTVGMSPV